MRQKTAMQAPLLPTIVRGCSRSSKPWSMPRITMHSKARGSLLPRPSAGSNGISCDMFRIERDIWTDDTDDDEAEAERTQRSQGRYQARSRDQAANSIRSIVVQSALSVYAVRGLTIAISQKTLPQTVTRRDLRARFYSTARLQRRL